MENIISFQVSHILLSKVIYGLKNGPRPEVIYGTLKCATGYCITRFFLFRTVVSFGPDPDLEKFLKYSQLYVGMTIGGIGLSDDIIFFYIRQYDAVIQQYVITSQPERQFSAALLQYFYVRIASPHTTKLVRSLYMLEVWDSGIRVSKCVVLDTKLPLMKTFEIKNMKFRKIKFMQNFLSQLLIFKSGSIYNPW